MGTRTGRSGWRAGHLWRAAPDLRTAAALRRRTARTPLPGRWTQSMPLNTHRPSETRALAPAPVAVTNGSTPRIKANDVMRMGRNLVRSRVNRRLQYRFPPPISRRSRAALRRSGRRSSRTMQSTALRADLCIKVVGKAQTSQGDPPARAMITAPARITANGMIQLSYWPARQRYTSRMASANT